MSKSGEGSKLKYCNNCGKKTVHCIVSQKTTSKIRKEIKTLLCKDDDSNKQGRYYQCQNCECIVKEEIN